jgi:hypothetical protein
MGRQMLPFALLTLAAASFWLPPFWMQIAVSLQAMFYLLAAIDRWIPDRWTLKGLSSPARTFVTFMMAALAAASYFFVPSSRFWKESKAARVGS